MYNAPEITARFAEVMGTVYDPACVVEMPPSMGREDFAYYLQKVPGTFFFTEAGNADLGSNFPHHHPRFDIDERTMLVAATAALEAQDDGNMLIQNGKGALIGIEGYLHAQR
ncbi:MAG: Catalyzes the cleavage of p-aminobenzoyl-glutamate to p-aminobenzoate and glutamate, subunit A [Candidatus Carbobacillus altaicus]|uniref:Catalyzes the cleavage of p-aminobenzoyl-glutamate to p-aminobenzoate and glutamate, subunit A n=1 Tax=Candidatus Carbonibacillus altaicus TaxID=2163959 RepID=A0A2R6Y3W2_9BACL|nr:MAG: Catalyzes the cleavage of p-aminobenzoyl-glutamate to p-aminobenzoate and glutamate, subunit A [Candidatus Carbobacillus altaicus]